MLLSWERRPEEIANLLNPAFCSILLRDFVRAYSRENGPTDYSIVLLALPLVLHPATREKLPRTTRTKLHTWVQDNPEIRVGLNNRVRDLIPHTRESLVFGMQRGVIDINKNGGFTYTSSRIKSLSGSEIQEHRKCRSRVAFLGRWLARSGNPSLIYRHFNLKL